MKVKISAIIGGVLALTTATLAAATVAEAQKSKPGKTGPSGPIPAGKMVYEQNKCMNCHKIAGKGGNSGPDLSNEGANAKHPVAWLAAEVKDPSSHKKDSGMPAYGEKIKGADLTNIAAYLHSLKKK